MKLTLHVSPFEDKNYKLDTHDQYVWHAGKDRVCLHCDNLLIRTAGTGGKVPQEGQSLGYMCTVCYLLVCTKHIYMDFTRDPLHQRYAWRCIVCETEHIASKEYPVPFGDE